MAKIAIIGAGKGGASVIKAFAGIQKIKIVGVCDTNENAPGIQLARQLGITIYSDVVKLSAIPDLDLIIEATGSDKVKHIIMDNKAENTTLVDSHAANIIMDLVESREAMIHKLNEQAKELAITADKLNQTILQVSNTVQEVAISAETIARQGASLMNSAEEASQHISETGEVLNFIRTVAQQTKLLGLNAAIEAARAGEHGRGFTVVADEVRKLAENSTASVENIAPVLSNIENSMKIITEGVAVASEITQKQAAATEEVSASIQELEQMAEFLSKMAKNLSEMV